MALMKSLGSNDLTRVTDEPLYTLGTIYTSESDHKQYKYVQWSSATPSVANDVCYYVGTGSPATGYSDNAVTSVVGDQLDVGAGVIGAVATQGQYLWIQIRGAVTINGTIEGASPVDGDALTSRGAVANGALTRVTADPAADIVAIVENVTNREIVCDFPE